jgi:hypothetical protein
LHSPAPTPTSTWWALVALWLYQASHGWGLGGVKTGICDPRYPHISGSLSTEAS